MILELKELGQNQRRKVRPTNTIQYSTSPLSIPDEFHSAAPDTLSNSTTAKASAVRVPFPSLVPVAT
ncbi:hypothetical protein BCR44DRAFT_36955, partial [Catenaria anguillulae PL171]